MPMNLRMEMNMKMNHMTEPQQMRYMMYSRTTMDGMEEPMIIPHIIRTAATIRIPWDRR